ncbi:MAG: ATP-binding protein [Candidatus Acidiferrales bacterium]
MLDVSAGLFLTQLRDLKNVNALVEGQAIEFNPKLTIVFGENACGKTGYVRVLKKAAAVRTSEVVLPDVSQAQNAKQPPSARIGFRLGQEEPQDVEWSDQAGLSPFNRIDVFDSRATALHVDGDLNYLYTPGELARFPLVQQGSEGVRSRLEQGIDDRAQTTANPLLQQFDRQSRIYPLIDSLGAATDLSELKALSEVTESEKIEIPSLKDEIEALQTTNPAARLKLADTASQHLDALGFSPALGFKTARTLSCSAARMRCGPRSLAWRTLRPSKLAQMYATRSAISDSRVVLFVFFLQSAIASYTLRSM